MCLMAKSGKAENFLAVMMKYDLWENVDWIKLAEILLEQNLKYHDGKPTIRRQ
jgi:hypothetical protein